MIICRRKSFPCGRKVIPYFDTLCYYEVDMACKKIANHTQECAHS